MDKRVGLSLDSVVEHLRSNTALIERLPASDLHSQDGRVARLLRALHEIDQSAAASKDLTEAELSALVAQAIRESGFEDPIETWFVIAAVSEMIGSSSPAAGRSWS
jgi:hypothetical protein